MIKCIAEHSVDLSLLTRDSKVLDLGCRAFSFANAMLEYVDTVYCVDADSSVVSTDERIEVMNVAVTSEPRECAVEFIKYGNGTGNYVNRGEQLPSVCTKALVLSYTIEQISWLFQVPFWSLIKIDIEGMEYEILMNMKEPIATMLTFELHEHTQKKKGMEYINKMFLNLSQWYTFAHIDYSKKHGLCENYWDVLLTLKTAI